MAAIDQNILGNWVNKDDIKIKLTLEVIEFIHNHYQEKYSLERIANSLYVNKNHLERTFRAVTDMTPGQYQNLFRCEKAKQLLENKSISITEIALKIGFNSDSHFIRTFDKLVGITPGQYRRTLCICYK